MTRADELILKLLDGPLADNEQAELERLCAADPQAARNAVALCEIEASLIGERRVDLARAVLAQIEQQQGDRIQRAVMRRISERKAAAAAAIALPPRGNFMHWLSGGIAAAALLALGIWFVVKPPQKTVVSPPAPPKITQVDDTPPPKPAPPVPPAPAEKIVFSQTFDDGLPPGWQCGKLETANLPPGVKGAVRQLAQPVSNRYGIHSPKLDNGFYAEVKGDDVVHFTFRSDTAGTVKLQVWCKQIDGTRFGSCDYSYKCEPGTWHTVDLPFTSFSSAQVFNQSYKIGMVGYALGTPDIGLVLTRFWITRKTP